MHLGVCDLEWTGVFLAVPPFVGGGSAKRSRWGKEGHLGEGVSGRTDRMVVSDCAICIEDDANSAEFALLRVVCVEWVDFEGDGDRARS